MKLLLGFCCVGALTALVARMFFEAVPLDDPGLQRVAPNRIQSVANNNEVFEPVPLPEPVMESLAERHTAEVPEPVVSDRSLPLTLRGFDGESHLAKSRWSLSRHVQNSQAVLQNPYFNPDRKTLSEEDAFELDRILERMIEHDSALKRDYNLIRKAHAWERVDTGRAEVQADGEQGGLQSRPRNDDEEVYGYSNNIKGNFLVRIQYGDDVNLDQKRNELVEFKATSIAMIAAYVKERGMD